MSLLGFRKGHSSYRKPLEPEIFAKGGKARYVCPDCRHAWNEVDRRKAIRACRAAPEGCAIDEDGRIQGDYRESPRKSLAVPSWFANPSVTTLDDLAAMWAEAMRDAKQGKIQKLRDFVNNQMAEPWVEKERTTDLDRVKAHLGYYDRGIVPHGAELLTIAIDVQLDHVWLMIVGWGYLYQAWVIFADRIEIGDTKDLGNWDIVREFINAKWPIEGDTSQPLPPSVVGIDCKYNTDTVQAFCLMCTEVPTLPIMGDPRMTGRFYSRVTIGPEFFRFNLNVTEFKNAAYHQLFSVKEPGPGFCHLHQGFPEDYLRHFTAEHQVRHRQRGKETLLWVPKKAGLANHLWDDFYYSRFLAEVVGTAALPDPEQVPGVRPKKASTPEDGFLDDLPEL